MPLMLVIGEKEQNERTVAVRKQGEGDLGSMSIPEFVQYVRDTIEREINRN